MKLLILGASSSRNSGGIYNTTLCLGQSLHALGDIDVNFLLYNDEYSAEDCKRYQPLPLHQYTIQWPRKLGYSKDLMQQISKIKPDLIHTQGIWMYFSRANRKYHVKTGTPYIIATHGMLDPWQLHQSAWKDLKKKIALLLYERKHLQGADCLHALCHSEYESIRKFGLKNPVAIIPNGTEMPLVTGRDADYPIPCRWNQKANRKTLLFLSRIHHKKGLNNLLQAWAYTHPARHDWQLVIAGETKDKEYMQSLQFMTKKLQIEESVQFIGGQFQDNKQTCFIDADAFILPSFSEGLPIAVLEAWSYGLPALLTSFCNLPEGFKEKAAIHIEPSAESIAEGIQTLIKMNSCERSMMGQNGLRLVKEKFTWEKVAQSAMHLYEWVRGKKEKPGFVMEK